MKCAKFVGPIVRACVGARRVYDGAAVNSIIAAVFVPKLGVPARLHWILKLHRLIPWPARCFRFYC